MLVKAIVYSTLERMLMDSEPVVSLMLQIETGEIVRWFGATTTRKIGRHWAFELTLKELERMGFDRVLIERAAKTQLFSELIKSTPARHEFWTNIERQSNGMLYARIPPQPIPIGDE
jgi:hypothetical protein